MLILILIVSAASGAAASAELRALYGVRGGNRVTLCMQPGHSSPAGAHDVCVGAMWRRHWVLVPASCVAHRALYPVVLVRDHARVNCEEVHQDMLYYNHRSVLARFLHPDFPKIDYALICVLEPFDALQVTSNASVALLDKLEPWLQNTYKSFSPEWHMAEYAPDEENMMFASPMRMFMASVVLPLTFFIAFFVFVTFYTGSDKSALPYTSLKNTEE